MIPVLVQLFRTWLRNKNRTSSFVTSSGLWYPGPGEVKVVQLVFQHLVDPGSVGSSKPSSNISAGLVHRITSQVLLVLEQQVGMNQSDIRGSDIK